jgi:threonine dehydratase
LSHTTVLTTPVACELTLAIVRDLVEEIVLLEDDTILEGLRVLLERAKLVIEPARAAATAALLSGAVRAEPGATVGALVTGGNIDLAG